MNHYAEACCLGELQELLPLGRSDPEVGYFTIVHGKTASQFASAATMPAILAGRPLADIEALRAYGLNVGVAFQIHDDPLDLIGDPAVMGKPVGSSLSNGRPLLPLIYLQRDGSANARREYARLRKAKDERRVDLVTLLKEEGILDRVKATQNGYLSNAIQALDRLRPDHDVAELEALAFYAVARQR
jgi:geranylgeranyl pyrophosphate synthase